MRHSLRAKMSGRRMERSVRRREAVFRENRLPARTENARPGPPRTDAARSMAASGGQARPMPRAQAPGVCEAAPHHRGRAWRSHISAHGRSGHGAPPVRAPALQRGARETGGRNFLPLPDEKAQGARCRTGAVVTMGGLPYFLSPRPRIMGVYGSFEVRLKMLVHLLVSGMGVFLYNHLFCHVIE